MFRKIIVVFSILFMGMISFAQSGGQSYNDLLKTAKQGDSKAQALVAYHLKEGIGVKKDLKEARKWALTASESQNGFAFWLLAQIASEMGEPPLVYRQYLESALSCEYPLATSLFARLYDSGSADYDIERDRDKAVELYQKAARKGDAEASAYLGYLYLKKRNDPFNAFKYFNLAASKGDAESMSMLASMYANGIGTEKNVASAYDWYKKAAEGGSLAGIEGLADCYRTGQGIAENHPEAFKLYSKITAFSSRLHYILGYYYALGEGVNQDLPMALSLLKQSAASGNVYAQAVLGIAQYEGDVPYKDDKDVGKALPYLKTAYENSGLHSLPSALLQKVYRYLSGFYRYGRGVEKDLQLAEQLTAKADAMQFDAETALHPFAYVGMMTVEENMEAYPLKPQPSPDSFMKQVVFDYPTPIRVEPKPVPPVQDRKAEHRSRFVIKAGTSLLDFNQVPQTIAPGVAVGLYDLAGSRIGGELGGYFCPGLSSASLLGIDAALVFRAANKIYPKVGAGFFSCSPIETGSSATLGLCAIAGLNYILGGHLCLEVGARYFPAVNINGFETVSTAGATYDFPVSTSILAGGIAPMVSVGWVF